MRSQVEKKPGKKLPKPKPPSPLKPPSFTAAVNPISSVSRYKMLAIAVILVLIGALGLKSLITYWLLNPSQPTPSPTPTPGETPQPTATPHPFTVTKTDEGYSVNMGEGVRPLELVSLKGGQFTMGSNRYDDEKPPHSVRVSPFAMGKFEVTQSQWLAVMGGKNPSYFKGDGNLPVESITWLQANDFCTMLSQKTDNNFRLPTEAEWEYTCRAGTNAEYSFGDYEALLQDYAWYDANSDYRTHPIGRRKANNWGVHDMHGNVWEWCQDWYTANYYKQSTQENPQGPPSGTHHVMRGGAAGDGATDSRSASRTILTKDYKPHDVGFRVVLSTRTP